MNSSPILQFCPRCGTKLSEAARFCAQCGTNLTEYGGRAARPPLTPRAIASISGGALAIFLVAWFSQSALVGTPPTEKFAKRGTETAPSVDLDAELKRLKQAAEQNPKEKKGWSEYAQALAERLMSKDAPRELVFEAIGVLRQILDIDPNDKEALLAMAEISFQQQAFQKSAEFYQKYLTLVPEDIDVRARYASSLSFVGKFDESLTELNRVLTVKPDHFHALAYSAVTYAEMSNRAKAREIGEKALLHAPNQEAKDRFAAFLGSLDKSASATNAPTAEGTSVAFDPITETVVDYIKNNPVAGKKFLDASLHSGTLTINLDNFPMAQMPPFIKQKFVSAIRERAFPQGGPLSAVVLYDKTNAQELERMTR